MAEKRTAVLALRDELRSVLLHSKGVVPREQVDDMASEIATLVSHLSHESVLKVCGMSFDYDYPVISLG